MKISLLILLLLCSCVAPTIDPVERCFLITDYHYANEETREDFFEKIEYYKDFPDLREQFLKDVLTLFGKAACRKYNFLTGDTIGEVYTKPLWAIKNFGGFAHTDWGKKITPFIHESIEYQKNHCTR